MAYAEPRTAGAKAAAKETKEVEVGLPTGAEVGDLEILIAGTTTATVASIASNGGGAWTAMEGTPLDVTSGERLSVWTRIRAEGDGNPKVKCTTSDHIVACRIAIKKGTYNTVTPIEIIKTGTETTSDTSFAFNVEKETGGAERLCVVICTSGTDSNTSQGGTNTANTSLSSVTATPIANYQTAEGNGGGFWVATGKKASAGAVGEWTNTMVSATTKAYIAFAINPVPPPTEVPLGAATGTSSPSLTITAPTQVPLEAAQGVAAPTARVTPPSYYAKELLKRIAVDWYWRLGDVLGSATAHDSSSNGRDGEVGGGITFGEPGSIYGDPDTSAKFSGAGSGAGVSRIILPTYTVGAKGAIGGRAIRTGTGNTAFFGSNSGFTSFFLRVNEGTNDIEFAVTNEGPLKWTGAAPANAIWFDYCIKWDTEANTAELVINGISMGVKELTANLNSPGYFKLGITATDPFEAWGWVGGQDDVWAASVLPANEDLLALHEIAAPSVPVPLAAATGTSNPSLGLTAPTYVPVEPSPGAASPSLGVRAPTQVPVEPAAGGSSPSAAVHAPTQVPLAPAPGSSAPTLAITVPIALEPAVGSAAPSLGLQAPTQVPLSAAAGVASPAIAVSAPTQVPLDPSAGTSAPSLAAHAPTFIPLDPSSGLASPSAQLHAPTLVALNPAAGFSSPTLALIAPTLIPLDPAIGQASPALALQASAGLVLDPAAGVASPSLALSAPTLVALDPAEGDSSPSLAIAAPTLVPLDPALGVSSPTLHVVAVGPGEIPLDPATGTSSPQVAISAPTEVVLSTAAGSSAPSLTLTAAALVILDPAGGVANPSLELMARVFLALSAAAGASHPSLALRVPPELQLSPSSGVASPSLTVSVGTEVILGPRSLTGRLGVAVAVPGRLAGDSGVATGRQAPPAGADGEAQTARRG